MRALLVLIFAAACGDDGVVHHLPDAPPPPDDAPDAAVQPVTLKVSVDGVGQAGIKVFFQNADSSLISMKLTDAAGEASELVMPNAFVTALDPFDGPALGGPRLHQLRTFAGVKPGDQLRLDLAGRASPSANLTFIVPPDPNKAVTGYHLYSACGEQDLDVGGGSGSGGIGGVLTFVGCGTATDIVIESRDSNSAAVSTLFHANVPITMDGTVDLTADSYQAAVVDTFNYTNIRDDISAVAIDAFLYTANGRLVHGTLNPRVAAGTAEATLARASLAGSIAVTLTGFFSGGFGQHQVLEWGAPGAYALDANVLLPEYQGEPQIDMASRTASWTSSAGASQPDVVVAVARFTREAPQLQLWDWRLAAPYAGTALTFPVLSGDAAGFSLLDSDTGRIDRLITAKVPGGYDAVRPGALSFDTVNDLVAGGSGSVVYEEVALPPKVQRHAHAASR